MGCEILDMGSEQTTSKWGRACQVFTKLPPLATKLDYISQTSLQLSRTSWLNTCQWMQAVIYTTSSLVPKNLLCLPLSFPSSAAEAEGPGGGFQGARGVTEPILGRSLGTKPSPCPLTPTDFQEPEGRNELFLGPVIGMFERLSVSAITLHWLKWLPESSLAHRHLETYS